MLVLDASVVMVWLFSNESDPRADEALAQLEHDEAMVPQIWQFEVRNCLLMSERYGRCTAEDAERFIDYLRALPIRTDDRPGLGRAHQLGRRHMLTFYDAMYLELAERHEATLASLDGQLVRAAVAESIPHLNISGA